MEVRDRSCVRGRSNFQANFAPVLSSRFPSPTGLISRTFWPFNAIILLNGWICSHDKPALSRFSNASYSGAVLFKSRCLIEFEAAAPRTDILRIQDLFIYLLRSGMLSFQRHQMPSDDRHAFDKKTY